MIWHCHFRWRAVPRLQLIGSCQRCRSRLVQRKTHLIVLFLIGGGKRLAVDGELAMVMMYDKVYCSIVVMFDDKVYCSIVMAYDKVYCGM
eukprot:1308016-Pyramimonas_sp.AAC.1